MGDEILRKNLQAMVGWSAAAADAIAAAEIPPGWAEVAGSDGTPTFQRRLSDKLDWLGATSMPVASAAALTASMTPGQTNGVGLGIGTGFEWKHFATRLQSHQMLFILETDAAQARLALSVCDLAALLDSGKLILLVGDGDAAGRQLVRLIEEHAGIDPPVVLHPLPTLALERRHALHAIGEAAVRAAVIARAQRADALSAALIQATARPSDGDEKVAMLLTPGHRWQRPVNGALIAVNAPHGTMPILRLDDHRTGGRLARMEMLLSRRASVIVTDLWRHQLDIPLPADIAVETWVSPLAPMAFWQPEALPAAGRMAPRDRVVVQAASHKDALVRAGIPADRIHISPPRLRQAAAGDSRGAATEGPIVAMVGDLPGIEPGPYGITLPSHVAIWEAGRHLIAADPLSMHWDMAADLFRRAQQRAGVEVTDAVLGDSLQRGMRLALMEALVPMTIARELNAAGVPLLLIGSGWEQAAIAINVKIRAFPAVGEPVLGPSGIYLHASPSGVILPSLLEAAHGGMAIAAAAHPLDARPAGLSTLLEPESQFMRLSRQGWAGQVRSLLGDSARRGRLSAAAAQRICAAHMDLI